MLKKSVIFVIIALSSTAVSCVKSISSINEIPESEKANSFDFATTRACPININYGLKDYSILIEVYTQDPMQTINSGNESYIIKNPILTPIYKAITTKDGKISETMDIPNMVKTVFLYTDYFGVPSVIPVEVTATGVNFTLQASVAATPQTKAGEAYSYPKGVRVLGGWNALGVPDYLATTRATHPNGLLYELNKALPATYISDKKTSVINAYLETKTELNLHLIKNTRLSMVVAHETANKLNSVGYFHYPTNNPPATVSDIHPILVFPNFSFPAYSLDNNGEIVIRSGNLSSGDQVELKYWDGEKFIAEFPANTSVGFLVFDSAFRNGEVLENRNCLYSITELNTEPEKFKQHCIAFESKSGNLVAYTFEDALREKQITEFYTGGNFRDNMFYIKPSENAPFNTGNMLQLPELENPEPQPNENTLVYSGTLAFEDIWPYKGDYDMNDIVIEYESTHYRNTNNRVLRAVDKFTFLNHGGEIISGFAYQFSNLKSNQIQKVQVTSGISINSSVFKTDEKGLEAGNEATIILFDNAKQVAKGTVFTVETIFLYPLADKEIVPPYNPFIVINTNNGRGHELHLPGHTPTMLMNKALLGMGLDKSDPAKGIYFASDTKYPFAIKIPIVPFSYPEERQNIGLKYPQFINWVNSNGATNQDWYLQPKN